jgi:hypothetical protein
VAPDLVEEELHGVGRGRRHLVAAHARRRDVGLTAVVGELEAALVERILDLRLRLVLEVELLHDVAELREVHAAHRLAALDECLDPGLGRCVGGHRG